MDLPIRVMHPGMSRCESGRLSNISLGGALLVSPLDSSIGSRLQVSISRSAGAISYDCVIDAYLVRRSGAVMGVEWAEFAPIDVIDLVRAAPYDHSEAVAA
ncbi:MAG TPA: PilZ domain-containing protein [Steroidobacteraceae bacterium]|jgi:hypothetical protein|nr:PilZ domain-containing protein [Steroidobacteraceae bacterium]